MCTLVHHLQVELQRSGRDDGGAGVGVSHTTIMRWVIRYTPEFEKRGKRFSRSVGCSWRVDETYIAIKGNWHYLYRAADKLRPAVLLESEGGRVDISRLSVQSLIHVTLVPL